MTDESHVQAAEGSTACAEDMQVPTLARADDAVQKQRLGPCSFSLFRLVPSPISNPRVNPITHGFNTHPTDVDQKQVDDISSGQCCL